MFTGTPPLLLRTFAVKPHTIHHRTTANIASYSLKYKFPVRKNKIISWMLYFSQVLVRRQNIYRVHSVAFIRNVDYIYVLNIHTCAYDFAKCVHVCVYLLWKSFWANISRFSCAQYFCARHIHKWECFFFALLLADVYKVRVRASFKVYI